MLDVVSKLREEYEYRLDFNSKSHNSKNEENHLFMQLEKIYKELNKVNGQCHKVNRASKMV